MSRFALSAFLAVSVLSACSARVAAPRADALTPAQRTQVVRIIRDALKNDPSILRDATLALKNDDARVKANAIRAVIASQHDALLDPSDPGAGNPQGTVVIAEFFDLNCGYCRQIAPQMDYFLTRDRDVRLVYKDLPLLGPASDLGSHALLAARGQGAYERLRDAIMRDPRDITVESIRQAVERLGLNWQRLQHDMDDPNIARKLAANKNLARMLGIESTPTFVIGGRIIVGADMPQIVAAVAAANRSGSPKGSTPPTK